jgi:excisionase family DNA binding protein
MADLNHAVDGQVPLLKPEEVAALLRVPRTWVYAHQRDLPGLVRLGRYVRFRHEEIDRFLQEQRTCE